ncbi:hypothetical protein B0O99DRAFT_698188 [Bisporella sp. PMI_857]|nr:hypothetical protein B0O99DRAFT_698188 [Bisporella sp. PMI_857]
MFVSLHTAILRSASVRIVGGGACCVEREAGVDKVRRYPGTGRCAGVGGTGSIHGKLPIRVLRVNRVWFGGNYCRLPLARHTGLDGCAYCGGFSPWNTSEKKWWRFIRGRPARPGAHSLPPSSPSSPSHLVLADSRDLLGWENGSGLCRASRHESLLEPPVDGHNCTGHETKEAPDGDGEIVDPRFQRGCVFDRLEVDGRIGDEDEQAAGDTKDMRVISPNVLVLEGFWLQKAREPIFHSLMASATIAGRAAYNQNESHLVHLKEFLPNWRIDGVARCCRRAVEKDDDQGRNGLKRHIEVKAPSPGQCCVNTLPIYAGTWAGGAEKVKKPADTYQATSLMVWN